MGVLGWSILYGLAFAIVCALAASARGRGAGNWFLLGFLGGVFALIAVLVMERAEEVGFSASEPAWSPPPVASHKKCPDCAEQIQAEARLCRFCGHRFSEEEVGAAVDQRRAAAREVLASHEAADLRCPRCYTTNQSAASQCRACGKKLGW